MNLNTADSWQQWYKQDIKAISHERIAKAKSIHTPFLNTILAQNVSTAIEVGIGTGVLGYSLGQLAEERDFKLNVVELDYCLPLLESAKNFDSESKTNYINGDTFALPLTSENKSNRIVFHQGLLEHFNNNQILAIISEQLRVSRAIVATVPSHEYNFKEGLLGNERLMPVEDWISITSGHFNTNGFYYGMLPGERYHICLTITE